MEKLQGQKQELLGCASVGEQGVASLKERVWELESNALEQEKVHSQQENTIKQLEQVKRPSLSCGGGDALPWAGSSHRMSSGKQLVSRYTPRHGAGGS